MSYICRNGLPHTHNLAEEGRACWLGKTAQPAVPAPARRHAVTDPRLDLIKGMIDLVPDGYYATQKEDGATVDFVRISRPTKGQYKDCLKLQTQHSERWENALIMWPGGTWGVYNRLAIDMVMLVIADNHGCARRYSIELQRCQRCSKELTDDRSRHYLIGPECESYRPWAIEEVNNMEENLGLSFEQLVAKGLPTRVWQEKVSA